MHFCVTDCIRLTSLNQFTAFLNRKLCSHTFSKPSRYLCRHRAHLLRITVFLILCCVKASSIIVKENVYIDSIKPKSIKLSCLCSCTWMVLKVLCATKAGVFSLISVKRNVIAMLAYVYGMDFIWIFTLALAFGISEQEGKQRRTSFYVCAICYLTAFSIVRWCCIVGYFWNAFKQLLLKDLPHRASCMRVYVRSKEDCISFDQTKLNIREKWNQNVICERHIHSGLFEHLKRQWN